MGEVEVGRRNRYRSNPKSSIGSSRAPKPRFHVKQLENGASSALSKPLFVARTHQRSRSRCQRNGLTHHRLIDDHSWQLSVHRMQSTSTAAWQLERAWRVIFGLAFYPSSYRRSVNGSDMPIRGTSAESCPPEGQVTKDFWLTVSLRLLPRPNIRPRPQGRPHKTTAQ